MEVSGSRETEPQQIRESKELLGEADDDTSHNTQTLIYKLHCSPWTNWKSLSTLITADKQVKLLQQLYNYISINASFSRNTST